jgi:hypothetical protein
MDGKASGEAFVVFNSNEGVKKALELDKQKMRDRWGAQEATLTSRSARLCWKDFRHFARVSNGAVTY